MTRPIFTFFFLITTFFTSFTQVNQLIINPDINMPEDSMVSDALISSLNTFLVLADKPNEENHLVLEDEMIETYILLDEFKEIQKNEELEDDFFYKPYLTNIVELTDKQFLVQVSYIGTNKSESSLRASFDIIAHKSDDSFLFSSPLLRNTQNWQSKHIHNLVFHYPYSIEDEKVKEFADWVVFYDKKLENNIGETHYYLCKNETKPIRLLGVEYKADYNGDDLEIWCQAQLDDKTILVLLEADIYGVNTHDLWHNRLSQVTSRRDVHRRVDCHIATLYGGLWGLSWDELFPMFKEKFVVNQEVDWLAHKKNKSHFLTNDGRRKNYSDDFVGALLVKKIEEEKGFEGVWELLKTKRTKEEEEYFEVLASLTRITKENYNEEVSKLIEAEINKPRS